MSALIPRLSRPTARVLWTVVNQGRSRETHMSNVLFNDNKKDYLQDMKFKP